MPLPPAVPREDVHLRRIECRGFRRTDGLWDVEGRLIDTKAYEFESRWRGTMPPGTPVHDMSVRLTIDEDGLVHDAVAVTDASPFPICPQAAGAIDRIKGLRIASGWTRKVKERLGGTAGCTHIMELLGPIATTALQSLVKAGRLHREDQAPPPGRLDSCYAFASDREVVMRLWPAFYTGDR